jgi:hypothetical protein
MFVAVDQAREQTTPLQVGLLCAFANSGFHFGIRAHGDNLVAADSDRLGVGMVRRSGEDLAVVEHAFRRGPLGCPHKA